MSNFKKFFNENQNTSQVSAIKLSSKINASLVGLASAGLVISKNEEEKFSKEVADLAYSDEVITELNDKIGAIKDTESEEEFVRRAKSNLADILRKKLFK